MFSLYASSISFENSWDLRESSSAVICFLLNTYRASKLNKQIYVNQRVIKISEKLAIERLH